jgi:hypothetical protein
MGFEGDGSEFDSAALEGEDGSPADGVERRSILSSNAVRRSRTLRNFVHTDLFADTLQCVTVSTDRREQFGASARMGGFSGLGLR